MIALERSRTNAAIPAKYKSTKKQQKDKELMLAQRDFLKGIIEKVEFDDSYWKTAKPQLKKESCGKCAYCEANTAVVAHGDVEHYRPKSIYWWLAYTYDNYLYACQICNQSYKSDNFPIASNPFPAPPINANTTDQQIGQLMGKISPDPIDITVPYTLQTYLAQHQSESAYLINPYFDDPTIYFIYEADDTTQEVKIIAAKKKYDKYLKAANDFYGLNRVELNNARYSVFTKFRAFKMAYAALDDVVDAPIKEEIQKQIDDMLSSKYLFAGMNRYFNKIL